MCCTSRSPRTVMAVALAVGRATLPRYAHRYAPHKFTQPQLFACLVLQAFEHWDYRGTEQHLRDFPGIRQGIGLEETPDHSTLHRAAQRFFGAFVSERLLAAAVRLMLGRRSIIQRAAVDGTGLESHHCSLYFIRRRAKGRKDAKPPQIQATTYHRFPKLSLLVDCSTHLILALLTGRGPKPDINDLGPLLGRLPPGLTLLKLLGDAGFDSEPNHVLAQEEHGITFLSPARHGRPRKDGGPPAGKYRRRMHHQLRTRAQRRRRGYTQRWQVETVNSMIKRNLTDELSSRSYHAQNREMRWLAIVHNIMV